MSEPSQLRLLTYNILRGGAGRERQLADVINAHAPDIVVFQEATRPRTIERIAALTEMPTFGSAYGRSLAFASRVPIAEYRWVRPRFSQHAFLELVPRGFDVRIFGVHLSAVHAAWTEARRVRELRSLLAAIQQHDASRHIVVGDFNTLAPNEQLDVSKLPLRLRLLVWLSGGRIRWQTVAIMLGAGYVDGYRLFHETDAGFTFPTRDPHVRLDYAFPSKAWATELLSCDVVRTPDAAHGASDHYPLCAVLRVN